MRRLMKHVTDQNWFAVGLDVIVLVVGIFLGMQVTEWNENRRERERTKQVIETMREDLRSSISYENEFGLQIQKGLDAWKSSFNAGKRLPPYYFRVPGSDTAPSTTWDALLNMRLGELVHPKLMYELAFYYSEREGVGRKYIRYVTFIERELLPRLKQDPSVFYLNDGSRLKPEFETNMDLLLSWKIETGTNKMWAKCLADKLDSLAGNGETCVPSLKFDDSNQDIYKHNARE